MTADDGDAETSEQRHALAMHATNDGVWDWDITRERLYLSPRWKAMLGLRRR